MKCVSIQKMSGNEVYYTIFEMLQVKIMLCGKLHCQTSFKLRHISHEISFHPDCNSPGPAAERRGNNLRTFVLKTTFRTFAWKLGPGSGLECRVNAIYARERQGGCIQGACVPSKTLNLDQTPKSGSDSPVRYGKQGCPAAEEGSTRLVPSQGISGRSAFVSVCLVSPIWKDQACFNPKLDGYCLTRCIN